MDRSVCLWDLRFIFIIFMDGWGLLLVGSNKRGTPFVLLLEVLRICIVSSFY